MRFYIEGHSKSIKSVGLTNALRNLKKIPDRLNRIGQVITAEIGRNLSGRILQRRSGDLYNSWEWQVTAKNAGWDLVIGSDVIYARIHEFGGWTGRDHHTRIKKSRYVSRAITAKRTQVRRILRGFVAKIFR